MRSDIKKVLDFILHPEERFDDTAFNLLHAYIEAELSGQDAPKLYPEVEAALAQSPSFDQLYQDVKGSFLREQQGISLTPPIKGNFDFSFLKPAQSQPAPINLWQVTMRAGKKVMQLFTELRLVIAPELARFDNLPNPLLPEWKALPLKSRAEHGRMPLLSLPFHEHDMSLRFIVIPPEAEALDVTLTVEVTQLSSGQPITRCQVTMRDRKYRMLQGQMTQADGRVDFLNIESGHIVIEVKYEGRVLQVPIGISWDAPLLSEQIKQDS